MSKSDCTVGRDLWVSSKHRSLHVVMQECVRHACAVKRVSVAAVAVEIVQHTINRWKEWRSVSLSISFSALLGRCLLLFFFPWEHLAGLEAVCKQQDRIKHAIPGRMCETSHLVLLECNT